MILVGAGGHAMAVVELLSDQGTPVTAYVDEKPCSWLPSTERFEDDALPDGEHQFILGIGGATVEKLGYRLDLYRRYVNLGWPPAQAIHASAVVSKSAHVSNGATILAKGVLQPHCRIGEAAIVNTGAIVEHGSVVGEGAHIAPGAIVLGDCQVGAGCMIGAGSVIVQGSVVPDGTLVRAGTRYPE